MPTNPKIELDDLNWHILEVLQTAGRASYAEIGRAVGLSAPAVAERIQKMEDQGVIRGFKAILDPARLGFSIQTIVQLQVNRDYFETTLERLSSFPEVIDCYRTTGTSSLFLLVVFRSMEHMEDFLNQMLQLGEPVSSIVLSHPISDRIFTKALSEGS